MVASLRHYLLRQAAKATMTLDVAILSSLSVSCIYRQSRRGQASGSEQVILPESLRKLQTGLRVNSKRTRHLLPQGQLHKCLLQKSMQRSAH